MSDVIHKQSDNMKLDAFEFYDLWLLLSIGFSKRGSSIKWIMVSSDSYNHTVFSLRIQI